MTIVPMTPTEASVRVNSGHFIPRRTWSQGLNELDARHSWILSTIGSGLAFINDERALFLKNQALGTAA
jgi:hypothetical protein